MKTNSRTSILRTVALAFSMVAVITAVFFFTPSTRALADAIIQQFGGYIFMQGTPQPDPVKEAMSGQQGAGSPEQKATLQAEKQKMNDQPQENRKDTASFAPDAAAASQLAGFTVLAPAYLPEGYALSETKSGSKGWDVTQENGSVTAMIYYQDQASKSFLTIEELKYEQGHPKTVERAQIAAVTVRGQPGVWTPDPDGGKNVLVWDENGITYLVVSNTLQLEEMQKIAEGLGK